MKSTALVFGTFNNPLATAQTRAVLDCIHELTPRLTCETIMQDNSSSKPEASTEPFLAWDRSDMEVLAEMIRSGECRAVVAQAYDLPVPLPEGTDIHCVPARQNPFDALLNRQGLITDELDAGSKIGVLCLRAKNHLQCHWPDIEFQILQGGVEQAMETHLRKSEIDGLIMPAAITEYLGIQAIVSEIFSSDFILPAPGQGALVVLGRSQDQELTEILSPLHSNPSASELAAELAFRRHMVTDMDLPIGVLARIRGPELSITGATGCGSNRISVHGKISEADEVGSGLAQQLLCSPTTFVDLLEAEFPQGLPPEKDDDFEETDARDEGKYVEELLKEEDKSFDLEDPEDTAET
ncbi:MAG: hypothetical protein KOO60_09600 [Gemmatimonadales bacterium]|nr:hypothetical protein [Gemmatimonadales bacterium]